MNLRAGVAPGYAQADLQLHERVQLTLGGRVDHYSTVGAATSPGSAKLPAGNAASGIPAEASA